MASDPQLLALPKADETSIKVLAQSCIITTDLDIDVVQPFLEFALSTSPAQRSQVVWRGSADAALFVGQCIVDYIASHPASEHPNGVDPDFQEYCLANATLQFMSQCVVVGRC